MHVHIVGITSEQALETELADKTRHMLHIQRNFGRKGIYGVLFDGLNFEEIQDRLKDHLEILSELGILCLRLMTSK